MAADRALSEVFASSRARCEAAMPTVAGLQRDGERARDARARPPARCATDALVDDIPMIMCGIGSATKKQHAAARRGGGTW